MIESDNLFFFFFTKDQQSWHIPKTDRDINKASFHDGYHVDLEALIDGCCVWVDGSQRRAACK